MGISVNEYDLDLFDSCWHTFNLSNSMPSFMKGPKNLYCYLKRGFNTHLIFLLLLCHFCVGIFKIYFFLMAKGSVKVIQRTFDNPEINDPQMLLHRLNKAKCFSKNWPVGWIEESDQNSATWDQTN